MPHSIARRFDSSAGQFQQRLQLRLIHRSQNTQRGFNVLNGANGGANGFRICTESRVFLPRFESCWAHPADCRSATKNEEPQKPQCFWGSVLLPVKVLALFRVFVGPVLGPLLVLLLSGSADPLPAGSGVPRSVQNSPSTE